MKSLFITQPYLLTLHPNHQMHICWFQRHPLPGTVEYGHTPELGQTISAICYEFNGMRIPSHRTNSANIPENSLPLQLWQCIARIDNLSPGEIVHYRCRIGSETTAIYSFHTAPKAGMPFRFAQLSDLQATAPCNKIVERISQHNPDFLLYSGDACSLSWRADQWFDLEEAWQTEESRKNAFFPCLQHVGLLQTCPIFPCPGNHEVDDLRVGTDKTYACDDSKWNWSIYMQIFRPLYPELQTGLGGKRWYSVEYGDLHICSLSLMRWATWSSLEAPGWRLLDPIDPDSPQFQWLQKDLASSTTVFKWVIQHWHLLNKGWDVQPPLCDPIVSSDGTVSYPTDHTKILIDAYQQGGVCAVSYGHSHVYERYFTQNIHFIEAANFTICYREAQDPPHPSGLLPIVEDNTQRSFLIVSRNDSGLQANGYYADTGEIFDSYQIADSNGQSVPPN